MGKIKEGQKFVCIKNVRMTGSGTLAYTKCYIYESDGDSCITNNQLEKNHSWDKYDKETKKYFLKIKNN